MPRGAEGFEIEPHEGGLLINRAAPGTPLRRIPDIELIVRDRKTMRDQVKEFKGGRLMDESQEVVIDFHYHHDGGDVQILEYSYPASFFPPGVTEMKVVEYL